MTSINLLKYEPHSATYADLISIFHAVCSGSFSTLTDRVSAVRIDRDFPNTLRISIADFNDHWMIMWVVVDGVNTYIDVSNSLTSESIAFPAKGETPFVPDLDFPLTSSKEDLHAAMLEAGFVLGVDFDGV